MAIRHIAFDLDGTLLDTRDIIYRSLLESLPSEQRTADNKREIKKSIGTSPLSTLQKFGVKSLSGYWRAHKRNAPHCDLFFSDTAPVLANLKEAGFSLSILTTLPSSSAFHLLEVHSLNQYFERIDGAGSLRYRKPAAGALESHLEAMGITPDAAAYVGDDVRDITMANQAGAFSVGVRWSSAGSRALRLAGADMILSDFASLSALSDQT